MPVVALLNSDDPLFEFEHMMAHRQYFAVQDPLSQFTVLPYLLDPESDNERGGDWNNRHQTAHDDFNSNLPSTYNNGYHINPINPPVVAATGNTTVVPPNTGTFLIDISAANNPIYIGATIVGGDIQPGTTIVAGPSPGNGTYQVSLIIPAPNQVNIPLTITAPPFQQAVQIPSAGTFGMQQPGILLEGMGETPEQQLWWTFVNHQQHYEANNAVLPLPTTAAMTAGTGPGMISASNPWWWASRGPVIYPFW